MGIGSYTRHKIFLIAISERVSSTTIRFYTNIYRRQEINLNLDLRLTKLQRKSGGILQHSTSPISNHEQEMMELKSLSKYVTAFLFIFVKPRGGLILLTHKSQRVYNLVGLVTQYCLRTARPGHESWGYGHLVKLCGWDLLL